VQFKNFCWVGIFPEPLLGSFVQKTFNIRSISITNMDLAWIIDSYCWIDRFSRRFPRVNYLQIEIQRLGYQMMIPIGFKNLF